MPSKGKAGVPSPQEVFCGSKIGCRPLRHLKVFGCPTYVLDPQLQDRKKIPNWEPRSRKGQFLGFSKFHASTVSLIRNIHTGYISPQFHVAFDELFMTVTSEAEIDLSESWTDLFLNSSEHYLKGARCQRRWANSSVGPRFRNRRRAAKTAARFFESGQVCRRSGRACR